MLSESDGMDVFRPASSSRVLDYSTSEKLRFQKEDVELSNRNPGQYCIDFGKCRSCLLIG